MAKEENSKQYDLEDRTYEFARDVRAFIKQLPRTVSNLEDARQLVNASGAVGSNYIEASEALRKRDFATRIKFCRKGAKESRYWLRLMFTDDDKDLEAGRSNLVQEASDLTGIFGAMVRKTNGR